MNSYAVTKTYYDDKSAGKISRPSAQAQAGCILELAGMVTVTGYAVEQ
jgi:hypothetical protein